MATSNIDIETSHTENTDHIMNLKQEKALAKSAFTRARHQLLHLLDEEDLPSRREVRDSQRKLNLVHEKVVDVLQSLSQSHAQQPDTINRQNITKEIEKIESEFNETQNKAQEYLEERKDELSSIYSETSAQIKVKHLEQAKAHQIVEQIRQEEKIKEKEISLAKLKLQEDVNRRQQELDNEIHNIRDRLHNAEVNEKRKHDELERTIEVELGITPEPFIPANVVTRDAAGITDIPAPAAEYSYAGGQRQLNFLSPENEYRPAVTLSSPQANIGNDLWKQLQRVSIPVFSGDFKTYGSWKAAFTACVDRAPATPEYKLLQLRQYLSGSALKAIDSLGHSATAYEAAKERLERKYGGARRQMAIYLEQLENFQPVRPGNSSDIDRFADLMDVTVINLKEAGRYDELRPGSFYNKLQRKLPESMLARYHRWVFESNTDESVESLRYWINKEAEFQTIAHETIKGIVTDSHNETKYTKQNKTRTLFGNEITFEKKLCKLCNGQHGIWACSRFKQMNTSTRWEFAKQNKLCFRCLGDNHRGQACTRSRMCGLNGCKNNHNRLLHRDAVAPNLAPSTDASALKGSADSREHDSQSLSPSPTEGEQIRHEQSHTTMISEQPGTGGILALRTIPVILKNGNKTLKVNALLDDGSTKTYINSDIAAQLSLQSKFEKVTVSVLNGKIETFETMPVTFGLESLDGRVNIDISAFTTDKVTGDMRVTNWNTYNTKWKHLKNIAFPKFSSKPTIDILIGIDYADLHFSQRDVRGQPGEPIARLTPLGWTCIGTPGSPGCRPIQTNFVQTYHSQDKIETQELNSTLKKFWEIENSGVNKEAPTLQQAEKEAVDIVEKSIEIKEGKYEVKIPWKTNRPKLPNNYDMALRRLESTEKKLLKNPEIAASYSATINKHIDKGYINKVDKTDKNPSEKWYLPHFAVVKPDRSTTKTRIVFDASAKYEDICLNDVIHQGPKLQRELFDVLLRFRRNPVAIICDIAEMYLRIQIHEEDRVFHRFLWRELQQDRPPDEYEFNRVVFGVNVSPFLAQFVSQTNAKRFYNEYPKAAETVLKSTYMDDSMDSVQNDDEGIELYRQLSELWSKAGMHARKWLSNSTKVLSEIPLEDRASEIDLENSNLPTVKTLGILWVAQDDVFEFRSTPVTENFHITKRNILRKIATVFDPLGFLSPYTIRAKVLMQELWAAGIDWDDDLDDLTQNKVSKWFDELQDLVHIKVPRCLRIDQEEHITSSSLQVFVDASQDAYVAIVYTRYVYQSENVTVRMAASKTRVAPLTATSIPRLELMAAVIGLRLACSVAQVLDLPLTDATFWSDSTNVLWWIRGRSRQFKPFVAHRVGEIQDNTDPCQWRHVPTKINPADLATRGTKVKDLTDNILWWQGPQFLLDSKELWPINKVEECSSTKELRSTVRTHTSTVQNDLNSTTSKTDEGQTSWRLDPKRFSSWLTLTRIQAWVYRFLDNCQLPLDKRNVGELNPQEINDAEIQIIKMAQKNTYPDEIKQIVSENRLPKASKLLGLQPKLDDDGLIRSDGRLSNAEFLPYDVRFPIILPRKNWVTKLIVKYYHEKGHHVSGTNHILSEISNKYWIISGREEIRDWERECAECKKRTAKRGQQVMAPLPEIRLKPSLHAFSRVAVDYGGPFISIQGRGKRRAKRYLCLFTCLDTRAVHLEMAYALDTDAFLNAFYRMTSRRGLPQEIISDNGGNFIGADRELKELVSAIDCAKLQRTTANRGVIWHFNPPLAPHFGGVHETMIKAAKRAIYAILGNADITDEELMSAFIGAEALLNSRPLTYQTSHPGDDTPLTPNHFIHGQVGGEFAPESVDSTNFNPRRRWRRVQELVKHFWHRWLKEWLPGLTPRKKWRSPHKDFKVGDIVLVVSTDTARGHWPLGRILEVYPGKDGHVRVAKVQTGNSVYVRSITRLCPVECNE